MLKTKLLTILLTIFRFSLLTETFNFLNGLALSIDILGERPYPVAITSLASKIMYFAVGIMGLLKGCVHLRHDLHYDLRFGACVIMTMHSLALT
jgi:hypothetical protein